MVSLGQESELGQLVGHSFTAFPGPTVHNPTALFTNSALGRLKTLRLLHACLKGKGQPIPEESKRMERRYINSNCMSRM